MSKFTVKSGGGYRIYDAEFNSIEEAGAHAKAMFRLHADSGPSGSGYLASQLPRIDAEIDEIQTHGDGGTVYTQPDGRGASWAIKKKGWF